MGGRKVVRHGKGVTPKRVTALFARRLPRPVSLGLPALNRTYPAASALIPTTHGRRFLLLDIRNSTSSSDDRVKPVSGGASALVSCVCAQMVRQSSALHLQRQCDSRVGQGTTVAGKLRRMMSNEMIGLALPRKGKYCCEPDERTIQLQQRLFVTGCSRRYKRRDPRDTVRRC